MKHVVVQGLGFVGAVLATVIASLKKKKYLYSNMHKLRYVIPDYKTILLMIYLY